MAILTSVFKQITSRSRAWHLIWLLVGVHPVRSQTLISSQLNYNPDDLSPNSEKWKIEQSFQAGYVSWDLIETFSPRARAMERNFDDENDLDVFYRWESEFEDKVKTGNLEHEIAFSLEIEKNLFNLARQNPANNYNFSRLRSPFSASDLLRPGSSLELGLEHTVTLGGGFSLYVEGEIELEIPESTPTPELASFNFQEDEAFAPEFSIYYEPSPSLYFYATYSGSRQAVSGLDIKNREFQPISAREWEFGLESQLFNEKMLASLYFTTETQRNVTATDPDYPDFQLQIDKQRSHSLSLTLEGEIAPRWNLSAYYTYQDAKITADDRLQVGNRIPDVAPHEAGIWSTYETRSGFGFGGGVTFMSDRPANIQNTATLPSYLQTDLVLFYRHSNYEAAFNLQNIFDTGDRNSQPFSILGTVLIRF